MPGRHADTPRRQQLSYRSAHGGLTLGILLAALCLGVALGIVAYAVTFPNPGYAVSTRSAWQALIPEPTGRAVGGSPSTPSIVGHPPLLATATSASFRFTEPPSSTAFECRLDDGSWRACHSPAIVSELSLGRHFFLVRGDGGPSAAGDSALFPWSVVESKPIRIPPRLSSLGNLYPGDEPVALPLEVFNPNSVPVAVTHLEVSVGADPPGCSSAENLELIPSNASTMRPLRLRAGESAWVPGGGIFAPAIRLRDLSVNRDDCENAQFSLVFSGEAHG